MQVFQNLRMDLARCGCTPIIGAVQGEANTRTLVVSLYDNGVAWEIPEAAVVDVAFKKPDGTQGIYNKLPDGSPATTFAGNVLTAILAPQMLTCAGKVTAAFVFHKTGEKTLATFPFTVTVTANPATGAERSEDYYNPTIGDIQAVVREIYLDIDHFDVAVRSAEASAAAAQASAVAAQAEVAGAREAAEAAQAEVAEAKASAEAATTEAAGAKTAAEAAGADATAAGAAAEAAGAKATAAEAAAQAAGAAAAEAQAAAETASLEATAAAAAAGNAAREAAAEAVETAVKDLTAEQVGAAPMDYAKKVGNPHNLLDNSDFRNPVNQRGIVSGRNTANAYWIDRWKLGNSGTITFEDGYITISANVEHPLYLSQTAESPFPFPCTVCVTTTNGDFVCNFTGNSRVTHADGWYVQIGNGSLLSIMIPYGASLSIVNLALYEGGYTIDTLPEYQPKGYGAELAECQRYYQKTIFDNYAVCHALIGSDSLHIPLSLKFPMRISAPTFSGSVNALTAQGWQGEQPVSGSSTISGFVAKIPKVNGFTFETGKSYICNGTIELSADL